MTFRGSAMEKGRYCPSLALRTRLEAAAEVAASSAKTPIGAPSASHSSPPVSTRKHMSGLGPHLEESQCNRTCQAAHTKIG